MNFNDFSNYNSSVPKSIPIQTLPLSKKTFKWHKGVMDFLEAEGMRQIRANYAFGDYRRMRQGLVDYADFDDSQTDLLGIQQMRRENKLPTNLKHFDLIGRFINALAGTFNKQQDTITIVSTDIFSETEFLSEKDKELRSFVERYFESVIQEGLIERGIHPESPDFKSDEEKQQYLQQLKQHRDSIVPPELIEENLQKDFKTTIVEWAEHKMKSNYIKFNLNLLDTEDLRNFLTVGRYFRNYHIGYDSNEPVNWDPERVFISEDSDAKYPCDLDYIGMIHTLSASKVISKFGHKLPNKVITKLYGGSIYGDDVAKGKSFFSSDKTYSTSVPYAGYFQRQTNELFEDMLGVPMGVTYGKGENDELQGRHSWLSASSNSYSGVSGDMFRDDINVRQDELQVTEAYFRSQRLVGLLVTENKLLEEPLITIVEEDLLPEYLEDNEIKVQNNKSWEEVHSDPRKYVNTITYSYLPQIWKGYKLKARNTRLKEDFYFGIEPLPYQILGKHNEFDVRIPVGGIIDVGIGQLLRTLQMQYNVLMNQNNQYLEKTLGAFFMVDWRLLPSHLKGEDGADTAEAIEEWRENIRDLGIAEIDGSPQNTRGQVQGAGIQQFDISYVNNIRANLEHARNIEMQAMSLIGMNPQSMGTPNEYMTAEGVRQGQDASYAQTEPLYMRFNAAKVVEKELELSVAQWCEANRKEISVEYNDGVTGTIIRKFVDENFPFRKLECFPSDNASERRDLERLKNTILQRNTMDMTIKDLTKVTTSKNFMTLLNYGIEQEKKKQAQMDQKMQHEKEMLAQKTEAAKVAKQEELQRLDHNKQLDRKSNEYIAEVKAQATLADSNLEPDMFDKFMKIRDRESKERLDKDASDTKQKELELKEEKARIAAKESLTSLDLKMAEILEKAKTRVSRERIAGIKKDIAIINPS